MVNDFQAKTMYVAVQLQGLVAPSSAVNRTDQVSDIGYLVGDAFQLMHYGVSAVLVTMACVVCLFLYFASPLVATPMIHGSVGETPIMHSLSDLATSDPIAWGR